MTLPGNIEEVPVRIGELATLEPGSSRRLVAVGLGSCLGVAIVDQSSGAAALAHVFLPEQPTSGPRSGAGPGTYAELAVPELVRQVRSMTGPDRRLVAVVAGGARMFGARPGNDVGDRNAEAVRGALAAAGVRIVAEDLGGTNGRTMRVAGGGSPSVTVRAVGTPERELWAGRARGVAEERLAA